MKIHENAALLDAFVDGELTAAEMAEVQAHLAECPGCQAYVDDALAIRADFPTADSTELPADFTGHIMQAVAKTPQSRPKKQPWGKLAAAAACLAVIVLVQYGAGLSSRNTSNEAAAYTADCAAAESTVERSADASSGDDEMCIRDRVQGAPKCIDMGMTTVAGGASCSMAFSLVAAFMSWG